MNLKLLKKSFAEASVGSCLLGVSGTITINLAARAVGVEMSFAQSSAMSGLLFIGRTFVLWVLRYHFDRMWNWAKNKVRRI